MAREATDPPSPDTDALGSTSTPAPSLVSRILGVAAVAVVAIVVTLTQTVAIVADDVGEGDRVLAFVSTESESNVSADQYPWGITSGDTTYAWSTAGLLLIAVATASALAGVLAGPTLIAAVNRRRGDGVDTDLLATPGADSAATFAYIPATAGAPSDALAATPAPPASLGPAASTSTSTSTAGAPPPPAATDAGAAGSAPPAPKANTPISGKRGSKRRFFGRRDETSELELVDIASALATSTKKASRKGRRGNGLAGDERAERATPDALTSSVPSALEAIAASKQPSDAEVDLASEAANDAFDWNQVAQSMRDTDGDALADLAPGPAPAEAAPADDDDDEMVSASDAFGLDFMIPGAEPIGEIEQTEPPAAAASAGDTDILRIFRVDEVADVTAGPDEPTGPIAHETWPGGLDADDADHEPAGADASESPFDWDMEVARMSSPATGETDHDLAGHDGPGDAFDPYEALDTFEPFEPFAAGTATTSEAAVAPDALGDSTRGSEPGIDALRAHLDVDLPDSVVQGAPPADEPASESDVPAALRSLVPGDAPLAAPAPHPSEGDTSMSSLDWLAELERAMDDDEYADPAVDADAAPEADTDAMIDAVADGLSSAGEHEHDADDAEADLVWSASWETWVYHDAERGRWFGHETETDRWLPLPDDSAPVS
ncbi:MAG: hypothetical protein AAF467_18390 [Actinomycetota bacterium]